MKILQKDTIIQLLKPYGFTDVDEVAQTKLNIIIETLLHNILENLTNVLEIKKGKVITPRIFSIALKILHADDSKPQNVVFKGGEPVLPSEYFGSNSGVYSESVDNSFTNNLDFLNLARPELVAYSFITPLTQTGGANKKMSLSRVINEEYVMDFIAKYKQNTKKSFKISKQCIPILMKAIETNMSFLLSAAKAANKNKGKTLTKSILFNTLKKHLNEFIHMSVVWK